MEEQQVPDTDKRVRLYTINQGICATFLGGPLGGAILLAQNYKQFGSPRFAKRAVVIGIVATFALVPLAMVLPEHTPNAVLPIGYSLAFRLVAEKFQGTELKSRLEAGAEKQPWWRTLGISFVTALCSAVVLVGGLVGIAMLSGS